jgi:ABC-type nitrate/sulfonate/bicarbonate transport system substrate-binding protein
LAALSSGQIDGAILSLLTLGATSRAGYHVLQDMDAVEIPYQHTVVVTTRSFLADNETAVESYLKAMIEARAVMSQDQEKGPEIIAEGLDIDSPEERHNIREVLALALADYLIRVPYPSLEGLTALIEEARQENPGGREITAEDLVDLRIVQALDASGFIDALYK